MHARFCTWYESCCHAIWVVNTARGKWRQHQLPQVLAVIFSTSFKNRKSVHCWQITALSALCHLPEMSLISAIWVLSYESYVHIYIIIYIYLYLYMHTDYFEYIDELCTVQKIVQYRLKFESHDFTSNACPANTNLRVPLWSTLDSGDDEGVAKERLELRQMDVWELKCEKTRK